MTQRGSGIIARARRKLDRCPGVSYTWTSRSVEVPAPSPGGFPIRLQITRRGFRVHLGGWWRDFDRDDDALDCLDFGLSKGCRLAVEYRGASEIAWTVESREFGSWRPHHRARRILAPFWGPRRTEYQQNDVTLLYPGEVGDRAADT